MVNNTHLSEVDDGSAEAGVLPGILLRQVLHIAAGFAGGEALRLHFADLGLEILDPVQRRRLPLLQLLNAVLQQRHEVLQDFVILLGPRQPVLPLSESQLAAGGGRIRRTLLDGLFFAFCFFCWGLNF